MNTETPNTAQPSFSPKTNKRQPSRRDRRAHLHNQNPYNNNRKPKGSSTHLQMMQRWNDQAIHIPRRHKLKGYEKEARRRAKKHAA